MPDHLLSIEQKSAASLAGVVQIKYAAMRNPRGVGRLAGAGSLEGRGGRAMMAKKDGVSGPDLGAVMIPAPEMVAFAERHGFVWRAHKKGDANRSARVEAPFHRIEHAFLTGENFADWAEPNQRARQTCEGWNAKFSNKLHASRRELFAAKQRHLLPLPLHVPEVSGTPSAAGTGIYPTSAVGPGRSPDPTDRAGSELDLDYF